jgi:nucleotide-binding universal stress UspA family protein
MRHILVPIDGPPQWEAQNALEYTVREHPEAEITVLHTIDPTTQVGCVFDLEAARRYETVYETAEETAASVFDEARAIVDEYEGELMTVMEIGWPGNAIVEYARENETDRIVLGTRGESGFSLISRNTGNWVVRHSPVPVVVVPAHPEGSHDAPKPLEQRELNPP